MTHSPDITAAVAAKVRRARAGLYGFIICLMGTMVFFPLGALLGMFEYRALSAAGSALLYAGGGLFAGAFLSFGVLLSGLLKQPRERDISNELKPSASGLVLIFATGASLFVLIVLGSMLALVITFFLREPMAILAAGGYFIAGCGFFFLVHTYLLARGIITANVYPGWMAGIVTKLRAGDAAGYDPSTDAKIVRARKALSKAQKALGAGVGIALTFALEASDYTGLLVLMLGRERAGGIERVFGTGEALAFFITLVIIIFTTMLIIKTVISIIDFRRDRAMGNLEKKYRAE